MRGLPQWGFPPPAPSLMSGQSGQALRQPPLQGAELRAAGEFPGNQSQHTESRVIQARSRALGEAAPTCAKEGLEVTAGGGEDRAGLI